MISLKEKGILLVNAFEDEIVQEANSDYQLSFKYPVSDPKWAEIEVGDLVLADDLHGEQEFRIFEITKRNGYLFVYANQVSFDLNEYLISAISVDRAPGQMVMSALAGSVIRQHPFSFFSDIQDRHTLNQKIVSVMDALAKGKHSIIGQWGGDLVRDKYSLRLLAHGGRDTEHLFMYKKNLKSYAEIDSMKGLVTQLHLRKAVQGQEGTADQVLEAVVDSPLIDAYKGRIFEHAIEVSDENITTRDQLVEYGQDYFRKNLPDVPKNSLTIEVTDNHSYDVRLFDTVLVHHEVFGKDLRLKITSYKFSPMSRKLKSIGFGKTKTNLHQQISSAVDSGIEQAKSALDSDFDRKLQKQIDNANRAFEAEFEKNKQAIEDGIEEAKAAAEVVKAEVGQSVLEAENKANQALQGMRSTDQKASEALIRAGASDNLARLAKETADRAVASSAQTGQNLLTKSRELQEAVRLARENLSRQADQIRRQAQAQDGLSSRLTTVEETANGTKATLTELSKTVNSTTGNLMRVTQRVASAEAGLSGVREQYSQLNQALNTTTGQVQSVSQKTTDIERGLDGVRERFENLSVGGVNLLKNTETMTGTGWSSSGQVWRKSQETYRKQPIFEWVSGGKYTTIAYYSVTAGATYTFSTYVKKGSQGRIFLYLYDDNKFLNVNRDQIFQLDADKFSLISVTFTAERVGTLAIRLAMITDEQGGFSHTPFKLEHGTIPTDWSAADEDFRQEFADYKRTVEENSAELGRRVQGLDGSLSETKTLVQQTANDIRQLATKTEVNAVTGRLSIAESSIRQQADQISQRLTRTEVDSLVDGKSLVSAKVFDNYKRETAQSIERQLTETRALIPTKGSSVNLVPNSKINESSNAYGFGTRTIQLEAGKTYWFLARAKKTGGTSDKRTRVYIYKSDWQEGYNLEFNSTNYETKSVKFVSRSTGAFYITSYWYPNGGDRSGTADIDWYMVVQSDLEPTEWSPALEDLVSQVDFNRVEETAQLYERVLGRTEGDVASNVARQVMTSQLFQTEVTKQQTDSELLSRMADGVPMTGNKHFATDLAGYNVYDNARTGHVTISRVSDNLSSSGYAMMVKTSGSGTSPWLGGFYSTVYAAKNKEFLVRLVAKIPIGRKIYFHNNSLGTGASWRWLSSVDGTGNYATYVAYVKSGYEGHFSNFGFWAIGGGATPTASSPLVWYVSEYQVYDITNSRTEDLTTRVTQLADSYAITTLGSANQVLSAVNVATGGVALQAGQNKLVVTPSTVYVQDGTIKNAMIESLYGGKIQAGTVGTAVLQAEAVTAEKMKIDQAFFNKFMANEARLKQLFAKNAFITSVQSVSISANQISGGKLTALNNAMRINLNQANIAFNQNATIEFNSANNALVRRKGTHTAFVHFQDVGSSTDGGAGSIYTSIGVTSSGDGINSASSGRFCGARFFRGARGTEHTATVDQAEIYGDSILLKDGFDGNRGFKFTPTTIGSMIDMNYLVGAVRALARCWLHMNNVAWNPQNNNLGRAVINEYNNHMKDL
ncbi:phage tail spike protein [Streptococcus sp. E29BA]|uniref:phage tail spike protein n=1 Tax=Streptococcus sp. E29BA TaxID=3278716 RepID=UPI00359EB04D